MKFLAACLSVGIFSAASAALAADKVSFGTNWLAEAEHGGYYQAVADGTYAKYGLDVTIVQEGGPQANNELLLAAGRLDFYMGGNLCSPSTQSPKRPDRRRRRRLQKDPQIFMSHPGVGLDKWSDLPKATGFSSAKRGLSRSISG